MQFELKIIEANNNCPSLCGHCFQIWFRQLDDTKASILRVPAYMLLTCFESKADAETFIVYGEEYISRDRMSLYTISHVIRRWIDEGCKEDLPTLIALNKLES